MAHSEYLPVLQRLLFSLQKEEDVSMEVEDVEISPQCNSECHILTPADLNDLVQDNEFRKNKSELLDRILD